MLSHSSLYSMNECCAVLPGAGWKHRAAHTALHLWLLLALFGFAGRASADIIDKQKALDAYSWWDNRDWDWYKANIPFFECPDREIVTTWYYRWELVTKHLSDKRRLFPSRRPNCLRVILIRRINLRQVTLEVWQRH